MGNRGEMQLKEVTHSVNKLVFLAASFFFFFYNFEFQYESIVCDPSKVTGPVRNIETRCYAYN